MSSQLAPLSIRLAQLAAITSSAWLSGTIATWSYGAIQSIQDAKTNAHEAARIYKRMHAIGSTVSPAIIPFPTLCFAYLAYDAAHGGVDRLGDFAGTAFYLYAFGSAAVALLVPWTLVVMNSTYGPLLKAAELAEKGSSEEVGDVHGWLWRWQKLSAVRSLSAGLAALAGAYVVIIHG